MSADKTDEVLKNDSQNAEGLSDDVGQLLRRTRVAAGMEIVDVAGVLRISARYLEALEDGRNDDLPGTTYAVGFVRSYAEHLHLDGQEIVRRYKEEAQGLGRGLGRAQDLTFPKPIPDSGVPGGAVLLVGLALAAAAYGLWYWSGQKTDVAGSQVEEVPSYLTETPVAEAPTPDPEPVSEPEPEPQVEAALETAPAPETVPESIPESIADSEVVADAVETVTEAIPESAEDTAPQAMPDGAGEAQPEAQAEAQLEAQLEAQPEAQTEAQPEAVPVAQAMVDAPAAEVAETAAAAALIPAPEPAPAPEPEVAAAPEPLPEPKVVEAGPSRITVRARSYSWIQIRDEGSDTLLFTRLLRKGDTYDVPGRVGLTLMTGNAGALEVLVDGEMVPAIGEAGQVLRGLLLDPDKLKAGTADGN